MTDIHHGQLSRIVPEAEHRYGDRVHLLADPVARTLLARLGRPDTDQPETNRAVERLFDRLLDAALNREFPLTARSEPTRMGTFHGGVRLDATLLDRDTRVVIAGIARAGMLPAYRCLARLSELLDPHAQRLDQLFISRRTAADGRVVGTDYHGARVGGDLTDRSLLLPYPLPGIGAKLLYALDVYQKQVGGRPDRVVALHLVVAPEYLAALHARHPGVEVYALRLDRGLSDPDVLASVPGTHPERERGLDDLGRVVPGLGDLEPLIHNAFV